MRGNVHSIETMALHDGPGIRFAVFFQGCGLRCLYCHNPDTWQLNGGASMSVEDLYAKTLRYRSYMENSGGGVTCTGGEPLLQPDFLYDYLCLCKEAGLHTAIDTAGMGLGDHIDYTEILKLTDLVLLDVKATSATTFKELTGASLEKAEPFYRALQKSETPVRIRHVLVPGINDTEENIVSLKTFIKRFPVIEGVELLGYHTLGISKYEHIKRSYPLEGVKPLPDERLNYFQSFFNQL